MSVLGFCLLCACQNTGLYQLDIQTGAVHSQTGVPQTIEIMRNGLDEFVLCHQKQCYPHQQKQLADAPISKINTQSYSKTKLQIYFDLGSSRLKASEQNKLNNAVSLLKTSQHIHLRGWADSIGGKNSAINQRLAKERAERIQNWLVRNGIKSNQIKMHYQPACCNDSNTRAVWIDW